MFGLMRVKKCGMTAEEKEVRRLNYCGTCKTIGAVYGQKARLLLNHDTVFLAEILSSLRGENVSDWEKSFQSFNCLSLPKGEMPFSLKFAATVNVILTEFKLADHADDEGKRRYKLTRSAFSGEFETARTFLEEWNFPLSEIETLLGSQKTIENESKSLDEFAFPTAQTTAIFFREGVKLSGKNELENLAFELGFAFGKLVYLLDAFEDYEKDFRRAQFNAFRAAFNLREEKLSNEQKRKIATILHEIESNISAIIYELPLAENQKSLFVSRLTQNLRRKLKTNLPVLKTTKICLVKTRPTFAQKWQTASGKARNLARQYSWQMPLVFLFVFAFALIAPAQTREAKSARECFDLSFNLMTLGAIFGSVLSFPSLKMVAINHKRKKKQEEGGDDSGGWCDGCDCDCCECCDDGCCGDGCCSCDCCSGCCDNCDCGGCCDCSCD